MNLKRDDVELRRMIWASILHGIGQECEKLYGKDSTEYKVLHSVAWGRYEGEPTATDSLTNATRGWGYLQGVRDTALAIARTLNLRNEEMLRRAGQEFTERWSKNRKANQERKPNGEGKS